MKQNFTYKGLAGLYFIMRVSIVNLLLIVLCFQMLMASPADAQLIEEKIINFRAGEITTAGVFKIIEEQTDFLFVFAPEVVKLDQIFVMDGSQMTVKDALDAVVKSARLTYLVRNNNIVIQVVNSASYSRRLNLIDVRGQVLDSRTKEPLPGVNVIVKGTANGTSTNSEGIYSISVDYSDILVFTFIGFKSYETEIDGRTQIDIFLDSDVKELDEVVINAGYYDVHDRYKTGSISKISKDVIDKQPANNPLLAIQGRVPGVYVEMPSGIQGSNINLKIRGKNSLQFGTDPLYVIDGIPFSTQSMSHIGSSMGFYGGSGLSPLYNINPNDIESIEILRDADATAIYGSRGANGVVLITTKRGRKGRSSFSANISYGVANVAKELDLMNTNEYLAMRKAAFRNEESFPQPYDVDVNGTWDTTRYTNWQKELIGGNAHLTNLQTSISGGTDDVQYLISGAFQKQGTVYPGDSESKKGSLHFSIESTSPNKRFKSRLSSTYALNQNNFIGSDLTGNVNSLAPNSPSLYSSDGTLNWENSTWTNPLAPLTQEFLFDSKNLLTDISLSYDFFKHISGKINIGINDLSSRERNIVPSTSQDPGYGLTSEASYVTETVGTNRSWILEPQVSWNGAIGSELTFSALVGGSFQNLGYERNSVLYYGFSSNSLINDPNSASIIDVVDYSKYIYRYAALFSRLNFVFKDRYIFNLTGRRDGSSRFGPGNKFANLGAAGFAWIFSNEDIIRSSVNFLSFGKIRLSYGRTGNDQIGDYKYLDTYQSSNGYQANPGLNPVRLNNPDYAWETTNKLETAIELGFLNDRVLINAAYYNNRSSNQLVNFKVPYTTGFNSIVKNLPAKIENSGIELDLTTINIDRDFKWSTSINLTISGNRLVDFPQLESSAYFNDYVVGKSLNIQRTFHYLGVNKESGFYDFEDMNGDGQISDDDKLYVNEIRQKYYGGINNSFSYKRISVDVFIRFVNKNGPTQYSSYTIPGFMGNQPSDILDKVWVDSDNSGSGLQKYSVTFFGEGMNSYYKFLSSDKAIVDQSFVRVQNVNIGYSLPHLFKNRVSGRIYLQGGNLLTITGYEGLDPETGSSGVLPPLRTVILGCELSL